MKQDLAKRYEPKDFEKRIYQQWEEGEYSTPISDRNRPKFCTVMPPAEDALALTLQDILVRWKRMCGFNTLWLPAAGRQPVEGIKALGCSADWTRLRSADDEERAVRAAFARLYHDGVIARDRTLVHWCPRCRTAISDVEVEYRARSAKLYRIAYPIEGSDRRLTVATTRPETMLGDTALAVHPDDERYKDLVGRAAILPVANRCIPVIGDPILVDPAFGTGVVKVTPAHDRSDYEAALRNGLPQLQVIDESGVMTAAAGEFAGLAPQEARSRMLSQLEQEGYLTGTEDYTHSVATHPACDSDVEPMISTQWFVRMAPLAERAMEVVRNGTLQIVPPSWEAAFANWAESARDWTISRQQTSGMRIPAFTCANDHLTASEDDVAQCPQCGSTGIRPETDVLDPWFSAAIAPLSLLGWPDKTADYNTFYPTDALIAGSELFSAWATRMIALVLRLTGRAPLARLFVSEGHGAVDPQAAIDACGADAIRFALAFGGDLQGYSAFANKIWNAARFALQHLDVELKSARSIDRDELGTVERWILSRLNDATRDVNRWLSFDRFDEASSTMHYFFWHELCDWYLEMVKPVLLGRQGTDADRARTRRVLLEVLDRSLRLLHPFMPFITEEIWLKLGGVEPSIMVTPYPVGEEVLEDAEAERLIGAVQAMVVRARTEHAGRGCRLYIAAASDRDANFFGRYAYLLRDLARLDAVHVNEPAPDGAHHDVVSGFTIALVFPETTDQQRERTRREIEKSRRELEGLEGRLANDQFVQNAPPAVVTQAQARREELIARIEKLQQNA